MGKKIKISVVTVSYNSADTIEKTIQSVISQPYPYKEYIIIDGGSTDGTVDIIRKYKDSISYWISEPDTGIYNAMNKAIEKATGELIGFLGSDDWYEEDVLEEVSKKYKENYPDLIYGNMTIVDEKKETSLNFKDITLSNIYYSMQFGHPASFVRTDLQKKYKFDETYRIAADYKLIMQLYHDGYRFEHIDKNISYFMLGGASGRMPETAAESRRAAYEVLGDEVKPYQERIDCAYRLQIMWFWLERALNTVEGKKNLNGLIDSHSNVYIFGTGDIGKKCLEILNLAEIKINGFLDNSIEKQKEMFEGYPVYSPQSIGELAAETIFIGSILYAEEMEKQLLAMNLPKVVKVLKCENIFQQIIDRYMVLVE